MRKHWIEWKGLHFSVSYETINASAIEDIHKYLIKLGMVVTLNQGLLLIKLHDNSITWFCEVM